MSALHLLRDGAALAAEFAALLFLTPISAIAAEPAQSTAAVTRDAERATPASGLRALHVTDAALELRLLGLLADVRVMQTVRNDTALRVDLGARLPAVTESVDELSVIRDGRVTDLLDGSRSACGEDDDPDAGRAQGDADEARADALQLMPGQHAIVAIAAIESLEPAGDAFRVALPATIAALGPQARVVRRGRWRDAGGDSAGRRVGHRHCDAAASVRSVPNGSPRPHRAGDRARRAASGRGEVGDCHDDRRARNRRAERGALDDAGHHAASAHRCGRPHAVRPA